MKLNMLITVAALFIACGFFAASLDAYFACEAGGGEGLLGILLGEMRSVLGDMALVRADDYFHQGVRHAECDHFESREEEEIEEEHHPVHEDYISKLNEAIHPHGHVHLKGEGLKDIFPLIGASIALDPHKEEAYLIGAYWLDQIGETREAMELLRQGLKANPESYLLYTDLGKYLLEREGDCANAMRVLERALSNWNASVDRGEEPDQIARVSILLYLGAVFEEEGRIDEAIGCYEKILQKFPEREGLRNKMDELRERKSLQ